MSGKWGGGGIKCAVCDKTCYPAETIQFEKIPYHVDCFKCTTCDKKMEGPAKAQKFEDILYCKQCFTKGGYAQKQKQVVWTAAEGGAAPAAGGKYGGGGNNCTVCEKTVYAAEMVSFEKKPYHGACMNCSHCQKKTLQPADTALFDDLMFCKKCFVSEGYNRKQAKSASTGVKTTSSSASSKYGGGGNKCYVCTKTVYAAETIQYEKKAFHGDCFKCENCQKKLSPSGAEAKKNGEEINVFCQKCWKELGMNRQKVVQGESNAEVEAVAEEAPAAAEEEPAAE